MAQNKILQFAVVDDGNNLLTQDGYTLDTDRINGNKTGVARSKLENKVLKQLSTSASGLSQFIADNQDKDIVDGMTPTNYSLAFIDALKAVIASATLNINPSGSIQMWATNTAPSGFLLCNGASYSKSMYPNLFAVIGYTFGGSGDTFLVPNYQNSMPIGASSAHVLASKGGSTTISSANLPSHTHTFSGMSDGMNSNQAHTHGVIDPGHAHTLAPYSAVTGGGSERPAVNAGNSNVGSYNTNTVTTGISISGVDINHAHGFSGTTSSAGSGTDFLPPHLAINFIIKV